MTGIAESAASLAAGASQKSFVEVHNPAPSPSDAANVQLSSVANEALEGLQNLKQGLQTNLDAANSLRENQLDAARTKLENSENDGVGRIEEAQLQMREHMDVSIRVQQQLAQFVMVSSVSSSFGKNLNMFLRGQ